MIVYKSLQMRRMTVEQDVSIIEILRTSTWREGFDILMGIMSIIVFIFALVFVFGE